MSVCPPGCWTLDLSQHCNNEDYGKKLEATDNQSYYFTLKSPLYDIGSWDILGKHNNLKIIRLVPDIPRVCVQIKLEMDQIDPIKKQGWD